MLKLFLRAAVVLTAIWGQGALADSCSPQNLRCLETQILTIAGVEIQNVCVRMERTEDCVRSAPVNQCATFEPLTMTSNPLLDGQCHLESETCLRLVAGVCDKQERVYTCWNGPPNVNAATIDNRLFLNFTETFTDNCGGYEGDANCSLEQTTVTQGFGTRNFNEQDVTRAWWEKERQYDCTDNNFVDDCQPFEDAPICTLTGDETCLSYAPDGSCEYKEYTYNCESDASFTASCDAINTCVGENCLNIETEVSEDYPVAAAWLTFLDDAAQGNQCNANTGTGSSGTVSNPDDDGSDVEVLVSDCETGFLDGGLTEPEVFGGESGYCGSNALVNCCTNPTSGFCQPTALELRQQRDAGTAHYLGRRCTSRFLGICIENSYEFCVYRSKFARVFQEQVDLQTGAQFLWQQPEECPPLTIEELENIDVSTMDMREVFGDMLDQMEEPVQELVMERIETEMGIYGAQVQETFE